jgi:[ribosomal protein S5]-alanine N-acetyltransferase
VTQEAQLPRSITIRPATPSDAEAMVKAMYPDSLQNFAFFRTALTVDRQRAYLAEKSMSDTDRLFAIRQGGKIIGTCGLHEIDRRNHNARVGCMLFSPESRGQGYGAQALRQLLQRAFHMKKMHKLYITVLADNVSGIGKYLHLGFRVEGVLRRHYHIGGEYRDMITMSLYADEWHAQHQAQG